MGFATYRSPDGRKPDPVIAPSEDLSTSRAMGKVYLYMGIALLITAAVAIGVGFLFAGWLTNWTGKSLSNYDFGANRAAAIVYFGSLIVSFIGILVSGIAMHAVMARGKHSVWPTYILYAIFMGILMSVFLIIGIDFATLGEAFGISAAAFAIMGTIGYFSKKNLNVLGMVALAALLMATLIGLLSLLLFFVFPQFWSTFNLIYTIIVTVALLIMVAVDTYNVKKIMSEGAANRNLCLYCAYIMYSDFIHLLVRVIILLSRFKRS